MISNNETGEAGDQVEKMKASAMERWGVDLADTASVRNKITELKGKMPDVADLDNLWRDYKAVEDGDMSVAA